MDQKPLVLISGKRIPVNTVTVTATLNQPTIAQIETVPITEWLNLKPRVPVHIFFFDSNDKKNCWKLMFEGEYIGSEYEKTTMSRKFILTCADYMNYWIHTNLYYYMDVTNFETFQLSPQAIGVNEETKTVVTPITPFQKVAKLIEEEGIPLGIKKVFDDARINNTFFKVMDDLLNIKDRMDVYPDDKIEGLLQAEILKILVNRYGTATPWETVFMVIQDMLRMCFYEIVSNPTPCFSEGKLQQFLLKPNILFNVPPKCNVFFPAQINTVYEKNDFMQKPTRFCVKSPMLGVPVEDNTNLLYKYFFSPPELAKLMATTKKSTEKQEPSKSEIATTTVFDTEFATGPIFDMAEYSYFPLYNEESIEVLQKTDKFTLIKDLYMQIYGTALPEDKKEQSSAIYNMWGSLYAEYEHNKRLTNGPITISTPFNPYPVVGFPCLRLDDTMPCYGYLVQIVHTFENANGYSESRFTIMNTKNVEPPGKSSHDVTLPPYLSTLYLPENVDSDAVTMTIYETAAASVTSNVASEQTISKKVATDLDVRTPIGHKIQPNYKNIKISRNNPSQLQIMSASLAQRIDWFVAAFWQLDDFAKQNGLYIVVDNWGRTIKQQQKLATTNPLAVTGISAHNFSLAVDIKACSYKNGRPDLSAAGRGNDQQQLARRAMLGSFWEGLHGWCRWGGNWNPKDPVHFDAFFGPQTASADEIRNVYAPTIARVITVPEAKEANIKVDTSNVGAYKKFLGIQSLGKGNSTLSEAAWNLLAVYRNSTDRRKFVYDYITRPIATLEQVAEYLKAKVVGVQMINDNDKPFRAGQTKDNITLPDDVTTITEIQDILSNRRAFSTLKKKK